MARAGSEEQLRIWYVGPAGISNTTSPTAAEINAGVDLTGFLTRDGLDTPLKGNTLDSSDVSSKYNTTAGGTYGGDPITATFHRDATYASDTAFTTLTRGLTGYFVVCRFFGAGTGSMTAGKKVEVWPIEIIAREAVKIAKDETQKVMVTCAVPTTPKLDQTVA
jgi:hypothetical protein